MQIDKYELFPCLYLYRDQAVILAFEVLYSVELRHSFECAIQPVIPPVIRTMQNRGLAARLRHNCSCMMAAHVIKCAQYAITATHCHQGLSRHGGGHKLPRL